MKKSIIDLFEVNEPNFAPKILVIPDGLFLIIGPSSLAIYVDSNGTSTLPPIPMISDILLLYRFQKEIVAVSDEFVAFYKLVLFVH
ncbi:hypothetical protein Ciccas_003414 [Cichlidogyrus casuarinus]|uniref:Uncharacterized protein n=1 Tax=Cichlidogyrus casuarinus TaxID=1844966 RepID=A0ABD2QEG9_9PLAT